MERIDDVIREAEAELDVGGGRLEFFYKISGGAGEPSCLTTDERSRREAAADEGPRLRKYRGTGIVRATVELTPVTAWNRSEARAMFEEQLADVRLVGSSIETDDREIEIEEVE